MKGYLQKSLQIGFINLHWKGLVCIFISIREIKIKESPGPYPANKAPPEPCI